MSQLIVCKNENGIILATDGKAIGFDMSGEPTDRDVEHLIQLSPFTAILWAGALEGEKMCRSLKDFVSDEELRHVDEIYGAALPFLGTEYDRFMREECEVLPVDPIHQVSFVLAGFTGKDEKDPFRLYLIWTKKKLPQLDGDEISTAFTVPRSLRLEINLNKMCRENRSLEDILPTIQKSLEKLAGTQEELGGQLYYATITSQGFNKVA